MHTCGIYAPNVNHCVIEIGQKLGGHVSRVGLHIRQRENEYQS